MVLLINDLSLHGQFSDVSSFREAVMRIMEMRNIAGRFGRELNCNRNVANACAIHGQTVLQAVQHLPQSERRLVLSWLTKSGPFWEDDRTHSQDDYLESDGAIVTDTAVGEAAYSGFHGLDRRVVSFVPSKWTFSPVSVSWVREDRYSVDIDVINFFGSDQLRVALDAAPAPISSWQQLCDMAMKRFTHLRIAKDAFHPLRGHPFVHGAADRIMVLLDTLDRIRGGMDEKGQLNRVGERLYQDHFVGNKAWFTDSSDAEKKKFEAELNFRHPDKRGQALSCTWHGKVKWPQIRVHFSWPVPVNDSLYVVYIGPKITKR